MTRLPVRYVSAADGSRVAYVVTGRGPDFVHMPFTFGATLQRTRANAFDGWYGGLAERFRLVQYEGRGHGYGERNVQSFTLDEILFDLEAVLAAEVQAPSFYLLASVWYANAALEFARRHPERLRGLILWMPYSGKAKTSSGLAYIAENDWGVYLRNVAAMNHFARNEEELQADIEALGAALDRHEFMVMRRDFESMPDVETLLPLVSAPTLFVKARDVITSIETDIAAMAGRMRCASVAFIDGSSVCPIGHQTAPTLEAIDAFVAACEQSAGASVRTPAPAAARLSRRETEITRLVARGRSNAEIAAHLTLSTRTVERHVQNIYNKLGVHKRVEAANWAREHGVN